MDDKMPSHVSTERDRFLPSLAAIALLLGAAGAGEARAAVEETLSRGEEAIHQVVTIDATPQQVYAALTSASQFEQMTQLSADFPFIAKLGNTATSISPEVGGTFTLFRGHISGRHIELLPDKRIVQAWRVANWKPGVYSLAVFELSAEGKGTKIVFDHTGFPKGQAAHLAEGWKSHYWLPLERFLMLAAPIKSEK